MELEGYFRMIVWMRESGRCVSVTSERNAKGNKEQMRKKSVSQEKEA